MIVIARCPCRISLLGGSTDLDWFLKEKGRGYCLGFSVPIFSRVAIGFRVGNHKRGILNYSSREEYTNVESITHPIIRACLEKYSLDNPIELASFGDAFMGAGLGSSSSFVVALIKAINQLLLTPLNNKEAARAACDLEINDLRNPIGSQDQYLCALGGINFIEFYNNSKVNTFNFPLIEKTIQNYSRKLFLINTFISRSASKQLSQIKDKKSSIDSIEEILNITDRFIDNSKDLKNENEIIINLEEAIQNSWEVKKTMKGVFNDELELIEKELIKLDFKLLKVLGAGGGGYLLVKYKGNNLDEDFKKVNQMKLNISPVKISKEGCETWEI